MFSLIQITLTYACNMIITRLSIYFGTHLGYFGSNSCKLSESNKHDTKDVRIRGAISSMHVRDGVRVVVGPVGVANTERDLPLGDENGRLLLRRQHKHDIHLHHSSSLSHNALPYEVRHLLLLRRMDLRHGQFRHFPPAGDQGSPH